MTTTTALRWLAAALAGAGIGSLVFWLTLDARLPTDDDWKQAHELVTRSSRAGEAIVLAPSWATRGRDFLTSRPVYTLDDHANGELVGVPRVWLVSLDGAPRFDVEEARAQLGTSAGQATRVGALSVEPFDTGAAAVTWRLSDEIAEATVAIRGAKEQPCPWRKDHFQCPRGGWNAVHAGWFEVQEHPMRCIWAHPVGPEPLEIALEGVPAGARLRGRGAFVGQAAAQSGAHVDVEVRRDGRPVGTARFENVMGRQPFEFEWAGGDVTFAVTTPNSGRRHFCFDAWVEAR